MNEQRAALEQAFLVHQQGDLKLARLRYQALIEHSPSNFDALQLLGTLSIQEAKYAEADRWLRSALLVNPSSIDVRMNLAIALQETGFPMDALRCYDEVLSLAPQHAGALNARGVLFNAMRRYDDAIASFSSALSYDPVNAETIFNRGTSYFQLGRLETALRDFESALIYQNDYIDAQYNRALTLLALKRYRDAADGLRQILARDPTHPNAAGFYANALWNMCDWTDHDTLRDDVIAEVRAGRIASGPFQFLAISDSQADQLACAEQHARSLGPIHEVTAPRTTAGADTRIRLAYLSPDFREHAVSYLTAGLFEKHDRARFEVIGVYLGTLTNDPVQQRIAAACDRWIVIADQSDDAMMERLRSLQIDIAIDLAGATVGARQQIFTRRIAPIQVSYLGFPGTSGRVGLDYIVADRFVVPVHSEKMYAEKVVCLPQCFQINDDRRPISTALNLRSQHGLPEEGVVFCSFHSSYKLTPTFFDIWMRILLAVKGSVLWVLATDADVQGNLKREAHARGVDAKRLIFAPQLPYADHLARLPLADLYLDTLPFNGGATSSDALWAGLPLVTCSGEAFAARMSGSLLRAMGLEELITHSLSDYEQLAIRLAHNPDALAGVRARVVANRSSSILFDTLSATRSLESAYETMWDRARRRLPPTGFSVMAAGLQEDAPAAKLPTTAGTSWLSRIMHRGPKRSC